MCDDWNGNRDAPRRSHERRDFSAKAGSPSVAREADKHGDASHPAQAEMGVAGITGVVRRGEGSIYDANPETLCYSLVPPVPGLCCGILRFGFRILPARAGIRPAPVYRLPLKSDAAGKDPRREPSGVPLSRVPVRPSRAHLTKRKIKHYKGFVILVSDECSAMMSDRPNAQKRKGNQHTDLR